MTSSPAPTATPVAVAVAVAVPAPETSASDPTAPLPPSTLAEAAAGDLSFTTVLTTLPVPPVVAARPPILTRSLLIRPCTADDLAALHALRTQPEVMRWTALGRVDKDLDDTRGRLEANLSPRGDGTYNFAICERESGDFVGIGGSHLMKGELGWPALGYMFRKEVWGRGYASEFVRAFVDAWWALPREVREVDVDEGMVMPSVTGTAVGMGLDASVAEDGAKTDPPAAEEMLTAITSDVNFASQRILTKSGFRLVKKWRTTDMADPSGQTIIDLHCYGLMRPGVSA